MSELYSDHYVNEIGLQKLSADVKNNLTVLDGGKGSIHIETSVYVLLEQRLADQSFRDMLTLVKRAKDGLMRKELNMHTIGPDGYESHVAVRGKDLDKKAFDAIRSVDDGDLYLSCHYEAGKRQMTAISKQNWYILYDKMRIVERQSQNQNAYLTFLDKIYDTLLDNYLQRGAITSPSS